MSELRSTYSVGEEEGIIVKWNDAAGWPEGVLKARGILEVVDEGGSDLGGGPVLGHGPRVRSRRGDLGFGSRGGHCGSDGGDTM